MRIYKYGLILIFIPFASVCQSINGKIVFESDECCYHPRKMEPTDSSSDLSILFNQCLINDKSVNPNIDMEGNFHILETDLKGIDLSKNVRIKFPFHDLREIELINIPRGAKNINIPIIKLKDNRKVEDIYAEASIKYYNLIFSYPQLEFDTVSNLLAIGKYVVRIYGWNMEIS